MEYSQGLLVQLIISYLIVYIVRIWNLTSSSCLRNWRRCILFFLVVSLFFLFDLLLFIEMALGVEFIRSVFIPCYMINHEFFLGRITILTSSSTVITSITSITLLHIPKIILIKYRIISLGSWLDWRWLIWFCKIQSNVYNLGNISSIFYLLSLWLLTIKPFNNRKLWFHWIWCNFFIFLKPLHHSNFTWQ